MKWTASDLVPIATAIGCGWFLVGVATAFSAACSERTTQEVPPEFLLPEAAPREPVLVAVRGPGGRLVRVDVSGVRLALDGTPPGAGPTGVCPPRLDWEGLATALAPGRRPPARPMPDPRTPNQELETRVGDWNVRLDPEDGFFDLGRPRGRGIRPGVASAPVELLWEQARPILDGLGIARSETDARAARLAARLDADGVARVDLTGGDTLVLERHFGGIPFRVDHGRVRFRTDGTPREFNGQWHCIDPARVVLPSSTKTAAEAAGVGLASVAIQARIHGMELDFRRPVDLQTYFALEDPVDGVYGLRLRGTIGVYDTPPDPHYHGFDFDLP